MSTPTVVMATDLATNPGQVGPLGALNDAVCFSSMDWGASADTAWIYGIISGWDGPAMRELAARFGWSHEKVERLRALRRKFRAAQLKEERRFP